MNLTIHAAAQNYINWYKKKSMFKLFTVLPLQKGKKELRYNTLVNNELN